MKSTLVSLILQGLVLGIFAGSFIRQPGGNLFWALLVYAVCLWTWLAWTLIDKHNRRRRAQEVCRQFRTPHFS